MALTEFREEHRREVHVAGDRLTTIEVGTVDVSAQPRPRQAHAATGRIESVVMLVSLVLVASACLLLIANSTSHLKLSDSSRHAILFCLAFASAVSGVAGFINIIKK